MIIYLQSVIIINFLEKMLQWKEISAQKEKYDRIIVNVPKGRKEVINEYAKEQGYKSLNAFVVDAINDKMN